MGNLLILGAGGHGRVVADAASLSSKWKEIIFFDDGLFELEQVDGWPMAGGIDDLARLKGGDDDVVVAVGDNVRRMELIQELESLGCRCGTVVHPTAAISSGAALGEGTIVLAQAAINIGACLGKGCIINIGATVDHDCTLEDGVHIAPGAHIAGGVKVGKCSWIGIGASVKQLVNIGSQVIVGAGAAVVSNLDDATVCFGVPAKTRSDPFEQ